MPDRSGAAAPASRRPWGGAAPAAAAGPAAAGGAVARGPAGANAAGPEIAEEPLPPGFPTAPATGAARGTVVAVDLGRIACANALSLQRRLARARQAGEVPDLLLLCEHPPVVTLGRASRPEHLLVGPDDLARRGIACLEVERGGDVTYHGPGQLVGYPILDLRGHGCDLHRYLRGLEEVLIRTAARFGVPAGRVPGKTGVWVGPGAPRTGAPEAGGRRAGTVRKLASIGIHVSRWVAWHGFALNVTDAALPGFELIVPCGLAGVAMTSLTSEAGRPVSLPEAAAAVREAFAGTFGVRIVSRERPIAAPGGRPPSRAFRL